MVLYLSGNNIYSNQYEGTNKSSKSKKGLIPSTVNENSNLIASRNKNNRIKRTRAPNPKKPTNNMASAKTTT